MSKIKVNDELYFYTDYLSVLPNVFDNIDCKEQLKAIVQLRVNERKQQLLNNFNNNVASLSIAPTGYCEGRCAYCVSGDTLITMSDYSRKKITDIKLGDEILAFEENTNNGKQRKFKKSIVTKVFKPRKVEKIYKIELNNGNILFITDEHPILTKRGWKKVEDIYNVNDRNKYIHSYNFPIKKENFEDINYKIGYIIGCFLGDGSFKKYNYNNKRRNKDIQYQLRFVVKDTEITKRLAKYLKDFNIDYKYFDFLISKKYNLKVKGIRSSKEQSYLSILNFIENNLNKNINKNYMKGFLGAIYDCEGSLHMKNTLSICQAIPKVSKEIERCLNNLNIKYNKKIQGCTKNYKEKNVYHILASDKNDFLNICQPICLRKWYKIEETFVFNSLTDIKSIEYIDFNDYVYNIETTEHTYIANNILVHNCYAKDFYNIKEYLSVENLKKAIDKYNVKLGKGNTIIYGGDPVLNIDKFEKLIEFLSPNMEYICVVTSLFYNDEIYNKLKDILQKYKNVCLCVSLDSPYDNLRRYSAVEDSHKFVYNRFKELYKIDKNIISTRATINTGIKYWDWIEEVENDLGGLFLHNCDWNTNGTEINMTDFNKGFNEYIDSHLNIKDFYYNGFMSFDSLDTFIGIGKACDSHISRLPINHKGERIKCVDNLFSTDIPSDLSNYLFNTSDKICENCDFNNICLSKCFYVFNKNSCNWMLERFKKWLEIQGKSEKGIKKLISLSVIQQDNK